MAFQEIDLSNTTPDTVYQAFDKVNQNFEDITVSGTLCKVSSNDTTGGYLNGKLVADPGISLTEYNNGSNEVLHIGVSSSYLSKVKVITGDTTPDYLTNKLIVGAGLSVQVVNPTGNSVLQIGLSDPGKVLVSSNDTTTGYLNGKLVAGTDIILSEINNGANETLVIATTASQAKVSANDTTRGYLNGKLVAGDGITFAELNDGGNEQLRIYSTEIVAARGTHPTLDARLDIGINENGTLKNTVYPASTIVDETSFGQSSVVGTSTLYARADHTHGTPTLPATPEYWSMISIGFDYDTRGVISATPVETASRFLLDWHRLSTVPAYFEVLMNVSAGTGYVDLWNETDSIQVTDSELTTTSVSMVRVRSALLSLDASKEYVMRMWNSSGASATNCYVRRLIMQL